MLYNDFNPVLFAKRDTFETSEVNDILTENIMLRDKIKVLESSYDRIINIVNEIPEEKIDEFMVKVSAVAAMIKSVSAYETKNKVA